MYKYIWYETHTNKKNDKKQIWYEIKTDLKYNLQLIFCFVLINEYYFKTIANQMD